MHAAKFYNVGMRQESNCLADFRAHIRLHGSLTAERLTANQSSDLECVVKKHCALALERF